MSEPEEHANNLPEILRRSDRPIVIYQNAPPPPIETAASNAGLFSWLAMLTLCLGIIFYFGWQVWNPGHDARTASLVFAEGKPRGLAGQVEERRRINASAEGLVEHLDALRLAPARAQAQITHPLINDGAGIDALRRRWDTMCANIRARIYDRRIGQIDMRAARLRAERRRTIDAGRRAGIDAALAQALSERAAMVETRRIDGDPALRCVPAAEAPACTAASREPWCNPQTSYAGEFGEAHDDGR